MDTTRQPPPAEELISFAEAIKALGWRPRTFARIRRKCRIPAYRSPGVRAWFIRRQDLEVLRTPIAVQR